MEKLHFRFFIKAQVLLGNSNKDIHNDLKTAFGDRAPPYKTVSRWAKRFRDGREDVEDDPRSGRPITAHTLTNIEIVRRLIEDDPHTTYIEIEAQTLLSQGTICTIIHDSLKLRKITCRWVPHDLTEENRKERVAACRENLRMFKENKWRLCDVITGDESWIYWRQIGRKSSNASWIGEDESPKTVVRRNQFEPKTMVSVFYKTTGLVHVHFLNKGETIDANIYINNCLKPVVRAINELRPTSGTTNMKFHHDNARPHVAQSVKSYLKREGFLTIRHPPYSPDLAPSDFWLFDYIKRNLTDHTTQKSLEHEITAILQNIPKEEYLKTFNKWLERMELCIKNEGHYFEHLNNK